MTFQALTNAAIVTVVTILAHASPARAEPDPEPDLFSLQIDIGRLGVMLGQAEDGLELIIKQSEQNQTESSESIEALYADLGQVVADYNRLLARVCLRDEASENMCDSYYNPGWLKPPGAKLRKKDLTASALNGHIQEVYETVTALTGDMCSRGAEIAQDEYFCAIE